MKKLLAEQCLSILVLLFSSSGMSATVTVVQSNANPLVGQDFTVTIHGDDFPQTSGATLGLSFNSATASFVGAALPATGPFSTAAGASYVPHPSSGTPTTFDILAPLSPPLPSGSFDALVLTFKALALGPANVAIIDNANELAWLDVNFDVIPTTYRRTDVPLPAAGWLLAPAFGLLGWRRRKQLS